MDITFGGQLKRIPGEDAFAVTCCLCPPYETPGGSSTKFLAMTPDPEHALYLLREHKWMAHGVADVQDFGAYTGADHTRALQGAVDFVAQKMVDAGHE